MLFLAKDIAILSLDLPRPYIRGKTSQHARLFAEGDPPRAHLIRLPFLCPFSELFVVALVHAVGDC